MTIAHPYLLFLGDAVDELAAKTGRGVLQWRPEWCQGQFRLPGSTVSLGLPDMSIADAVAEGVRTMIVGVANPGGVISPAWHSSLLNAAAAGLNLANGMHDRLAAVPGLAEAAEIAGCQLHDVRHVDHALPIGTGEPRPGRRLLTVGTDCSVGKMYTSLALESEMRARGMRTEFRATGQTGILIAGAGVAVDAVPADFISGAVEWLSPANDPDHWDLIEGQGSLFHPSYAGVSLGLLHGAQAEALVVCHEPTRAHMRGRIHQPLPTLEQTIEANLMSGRLTHPDVRVVGLSINTSQLDESSARDYLDETAARLGLPCVDPLRTGVSDLVDALNVEPSGAPCGD